MPFIFAHLPARCMQSLSVFLLFFLFTGASFAQARLTIENNSARTMTVKIMRGSEQFSSLHETVTIAPHGAETVYFGQTGHYFTKTKAVSNGRDPIYQKGQPFHVVNDDTGYSVLTITFTIRESAVPQVSGGKQISKQEFDRN